MNTSRMNRLEELGRVDAEKAYTKTGKANLSDEKSRIVRELKADGGKVDSKKRKVSTSKTKAFRKAKDKKEDLRFKKIIHEKKFGDRPKLKKTAQSTVTGYQAAEQNKVNKAIGQTYNPYNPKSKKNPGGYADGGMVNVSGRGQGKVMAGRKKTTYIC